MRGILFISFFAFLFLPERGFSQFLNEIDQKVFLKINSSNNAFTQKGAVWLSGSAGPAALLVPAGILGIEFLRNDSLRPEAAALVLGSAGLSLSLAWISKKIFERQRPFQQLNGIQVASPLPTDPGMPSGHSSAAFGTAVALCMEYPRWEVVTPSLLWAGGVGLSRIMLGHHYPGDVLAGAALGTGCAWLSRKASRYLNTGTFRRPDKKPKG
jgi:membrane-associated phospholipid phosphatase